MSLLEASSFPDDWYGWASNELAHITIGIFAAVMLCLVSWLVVGALPYRVLVFAIVVMSYTAFKVFIQKADVGDIMDDVAFLGVYGAGGTLATFHEVSVGSLSVMGSIVPTIPFFAVGLFHLFAGIYHRRKGSTT